MEVVRIKKILARNLLLFIDLHCVRRSSWTVTTLATLTYIHNKDFPKCSYFQSNEPIMIMKYENSKWVDSLFNLGSLFKINLWRFPSFQAPAKYPLVIPFWLSKRYIWLCRGVINRKAGKATDLPKFSDTLTLSQ